MDVRDVPAGAAGMITVGNRPVRRMGFGAMRLCGPRIIGPPADPKSAADVLRRAVELGVQFIDTADAYGPHTNEELIAQTLHPYPSDLLIATKGGSVRGPNGEWGRDGRPEHLREACEGSLKRLRVEQIDLYQLHAVDERVPFEETIGTLADLQREGKIRHVGLSNVDVEQIERAQQIVPIVSVQNAYNATDRESEGVLEFCKRQGIAFIPYFPIGAGELADDSCLSVIAKRHDATPAQIALAWLLARSPVMLPIPGTSSRAHLEENVAAAAIALSAEEVAMIADDGAKRSI